MRKVFQEELTQVGDDLIEISKLVHEAITKATTSFEGADVDLAQDVIAADARIDFLQNSLDERAIDILALQGPVASDLRMIVGSLRMSASPMRRATGRRLGSRMSGESHAGAAARYGCQCRPACP